MPRPCQAHPAGSIPAPDIPCCCTHPPFPVPAWPDLDAHPPAAAFAGQAWLPQVWTILTAVEAIGHASPDLARAVQQQWATAPAELDMRRGRRSVLSVARYLLRMNGRPTPVGLLAEVTSVEFDPARAAAAVWGEQHRTVAQPSAGWLAELIAEPLAGCPMIAPVVINVASLS